MLWRQVGNMGTFFTTDSKFLKIDSTKIVEVQPYPSTWDIGIITTEVPQDFKVNIDAGTSPDITIDWGDGTIETFTTTGIKTHTYNGINSYTIKIGGSFGGNNGRITFDETDTAPLLHTTSVIPSMGLNSFNSTFRYCSNLKKVPFDIFWYNNTTTSSVFSSVFNQCSSLEYIPDSLFSKATNITASAFIGAFNQCTSLTKIPENLFKNNTSVTTSCFQSCFSGCSNITQIPQNLFRYNTQITSNAFYLCFASCPSLQSIPTDLFRYNTLVTTNAFYSTFLNCTSLNYVPTDLFRYNTLASTLSFRETFRGCSSLESVPEYLFKYNTSSTSFMYVFFGCSKLSLNPWIFYGPDGSDIDKNNRFLNKTVDFNQSMRVSSFTGIQGTAPDLWNCNFGTGTPTTTSCFVGHSSGSLTNWNDIPVAWGGSA